MRRTTSATLAAALLVAAGAVATTGAVQASGNGPGQHHGHHGHHGHGKSLTVGMYDVAGTRVGKVKMRQRGGVIEVTGTVGSLTPGFHGFHVHTTGICDPAAPNGPFTSAGGHYVGSGGSHGDHDGDLPSLLADEYGAARIWFTTDRFTLAELKADDGSAVMIHGGRDNYANIPTRYSAGGIAGPDAATLATGDAGNRVLCGVID
ncbi:MAG TPA: superoxide dismutase family protein [Nocardioides sp.]|uniref:superoxide dismutase family protein n=1 Tax=Nocardioides sp. TaxID=35761 RepID=UPI002CEAA1FE|nr:superoxide dismutase family protein [Nocardioides sp.]HTW16140.1 superoxide dismutase family protein [Nocardioides sp.]